MAVIEVSTWSDFVVAVATSGNTVKLTADIDCNDEIPYGVGSTISIYSNVDGQGYEIRNLRTHVTTPVTIFRIEGSATISNVKFINLVMDGSGVYLFNNSGYEAILTLNRCAFVGRRKGCLINGKGGGYGTYTTCTSCFFNVPSYGTVSALFKEQDTSPRLNFCWIRETYTGTFSDLMTSLPMCTMNGCYCDGTVKVPTGGTKTIGFDYATGQLQSVFDYDFVATSDASSTTYSVVYPKSVVRAQVRSYSDPSIIYTPTFNAAGTGTIVATPAEMIDPAALYAKGFDIVVP
jgi:hypothetical protein